MKYLKFYEAFKSKGISNTLKFINEKTGQQSANLFLEALREFMSAVDYPIDQISDDNIKYMSAKKALQLKSESQVTNERGIRFLKYWFSLKDGFLGTTVTGNETRKREQTEGHGLRNQRPFSDPELEYIKQNITRTGEIWPVSDYNKLKTGDDVIGFFDSSSYLERLSMAKIFVDERDNNRTYAIQPVSSGSEPNNNPTWRQWTQYGSLSWWIFDNSELGSDHCKLHFYRPSTDELHYIEPPKSDKVEEVEKEEDPYEWNLPHNNRFNFSSWGRGSSISSSDLEKADFALVLYYDDLVNPDADAILYEKPSETKQQRREEKRGATKLLTDEEIKKMNIERYIQKLVVSLNITETEFFDLQKIVSKHLCQEFTYISIYLQRPDWTDLSDFTDYLYKVVDSQDKSYYVSQTKSLYSRVTKKYYEHLMKFQDCKKYIKGENNLKKFFDELFKLGLEINQLLTNKKINSIDELWLSKSKIRAIYDFIKLNRNQFSYQVREVISGFRYQDEMDYYFNNQKENYTDEEYKIDLEKIERIRTFIKSV